MLNKTSLFMIGLIGSMAVTMTMITFLIFTPDESEIVDKQLLKVLSSCEEKWLSEQAYMKYGTLSTLTDEKIVYSNATHYIDNIECQWAFAIPNKDTQDLPVYDDWEIKFEDYYGNNYTEKSD